MSNWDADQIECYEIWDVTIPPIPSRSRLYSLEPIGIGTPYVESLTSYIIRLAETHCVSVKTLVSKEIWPLLRKQDNSENRTWGQDAYSMNNAGYFAKEWVYILERLTKRNDIQFLTMLPWSNIISHRGMLHSTRVWCPVCYTEWQHKQIYDPLIWSLKVSKICHRHQTLLQAQCPYDDCKRAQPPLLLRSSFGYCSYCKRWLGVSNTVDIVEKDVIAEEAKQYLWIASAVEELLAATPTIAGFLQQVNIASIIKYYACWIAEGDIVLLSRHLDIKLGIFYSWIRRGSIPMFHTLLHICARLNISPLFFLMNEKANTCTQVDMPLLKSTLRKPDEMKKILEKFFNRDIPVSLQQIADSMGYRSKDSLIRRFPELCRGIEARYNSYKNVVPVINSAESFTNIEVKHLLENYINNNAIIPPMAEIARCYGYKSTRDLSCDYPELYSLVQAKRHKQMNEKHVQMKCALEAVIRKKNPPFPTLKEVASKLDCSSSVLSNRFPELCRLMKQKKLDQYNLDEIQKKLENIAASDEYPPMSLHEVSRRIGYSVSWLRYYFPEFCREISTRYRLYNNGRSKIRKQRVYEQVKEVVMNSHKQGV